jgi:LemA protein
MLWILAIACAVLAIGIVLYNRLVTLRNGSESAWSDIDVQLKRRHNLIPNLVETVKGYAQHEQKTFAEVTEARGRAERAHGAGDRSGAENALGRAITHLFAVAEAYPELQASENFRQLQAELSAIENAIPRPKRARCRKSNSALE